MAQVDVYPTLVDLLGLPLPTADSFPLEGLSLRRTGSGDEEDLLSLSRFSRP